MGKSRPELVPDTCIRTHRIRNEAWSRGTLHARACNRRLLNEHERELTDLSDTICSPPYRRSSLDRSLIRNILFFFRDAGQRVVPRNEAAMLRESLDR